MEFEENYEIIVSQKYVRLSKLELIYFTFLLISFRTYPNINLYFEIFKNFGAVYLCCAKTELRGY